MAKFRSRANARSHSAMAWRPRFEKIRRRPRNKWANAWPGASERALVKAALAVARRAARSSVVYAPANSVRSSVFISGRCRDELMGVLWGVYVVVFVG